MLGSAACNDGGNAKESTISLPHDTSLRQIKPAGWTIACPRVRHAGDKKEL
jgi:hypothetical protein